MPNPNRNDNKGYPGYVISLQHHPEPEFVGPFRVALRKDGKGWEVLDAGANVVYPSEGSPPVTSGKDAHDWAVRKVEEGKRYA